MTSFIKKIGFGVLCLLGSSVWAQPVLNWSKTYGGNGFDEAYDIKALPNGGFIAVGTTNSPNNGDVFGLHGDADHNDAWVIMIDEAGFMQWQRCIGGTDSELALALAIMPDGGCVITGPSSSSDFDIPDNKGASDYWVSRLSPHGDILWSKTWGGSELDRPEDIIVDQQGNILVIGYINSQDGDVTHNNGGQDVWLLKIDPQGDLIWQKSYGGSSTDRGSVLTTLANGNYVFAASTHSKNGDVINTVTGQSIWLVYLDTSGTIYRQMILDGLNAKDLITTLDNGLCLAGGTLQGSFENTNYVIHKIDSSGAVQWSKVYGGNNIDEAYGLRQTPDSSFWITGWTQSSDGDITGFFNSDYPDNWLVWLDKDGALVWQNALGGRYADAGIAIDLQFDNIIIAGWAGSKDGDIQKKDFKGFTDFWIMRFQTNPVGLPELNTLQPLIYPNPFQYSTEIRLPETHTHLTLTLFDALGRQVYTTETHHSASITLNRNLLPEGVYLYQLVNQAGQSARGKVVITD